MYVIRRLSDGKFWLNLDYHGLVRRQYGTREDKDPGWTADITKTNPFKTSAGALSSRGGPGWIRKEYPFGERYRRKTWEEAGLELIEVDVTIKLGDEEKGRKRGEENGTKVLSKV